MTTSVHASVSPDGAPVVDPSDCRALVTPTGARSEFPYPIADVVYVDDAPDTPGAVVLVVRLEVPPRGRLNENVFGVGRDGGIAWQITDRGAIGPDSPYTDLVPDGDRVRCGNWSGAELWLAPATGAEVGARRSR